MSGPKAGDRVSEYILQSPLGTGTFGQVWKAVHHIWKDRIVAIKIPTDSQYVRHLRQEGLTLHGLHHPNIVEALGLDPYADPPYFVMEYVDGCSLRELIRRYPRGLPIGAVHVVMAGVLAGLEHAHAAGVVHRDIKPENILISGGADGRTETPAAEDVKITDFGLGRAGGLTTHSILQSGSLQAEGGGSISGTLVYMSPEQRDGAEADARTDLYALGVVLFEMCCGERPGGTETPGMIRPDLPAWVDRVFPRLYARRERRLSSAREVADAIREASTPPVVAGRSPAQSGPRPGAQTQRCPGCGAAVDAADNFCTACGQQLVSRPLRCGHCRAFLEADDRFCIFCGAPVGAACA